MSVNQSYSDLTSVGYQKLESFRGNNDNNRLPSVSDSVISQNPSELRGCSQFESELQSFVEALEESDTIDEAYVKGIGEDAFGKLLSLFDKAVGQLGSATKVRDAGADKFKVGEYLENSREYFEDFREELDSLEGEINEIISGSEPAVESAFKDLQTAIVNFKPVINIFVNTISSLLRELDIE